MITVIHTPTGETMGEFPHTQAARQWIKMGDTDSWGDFHAVDENGAQVEIPFMNTPRI